MKKAIIVSRLEKGRILCEKLCAKNVLPTLVITEEADKESTHISENITVIQGKLPLDSIEHVLSGFDVVLDATEWEETEEREKICSASKKAGIPYLYVQAPRSELFGIQIKRCSSAKEAVAYLNEQNGNILLTNIKNELSLFTEVIGFQERCKVRAMPTMDSILACNVAGFSGEQVLATAGIYSVAFLKQLLIEMKARFVVTAETEAGSEESNMIEAVKSLGITFVVIQKENSQKENPIEDAVQTALQYLRETE